jgi:hypothetical protein
MLQNVDLDTEFVAILRWKWTRCCISKCKFTLNGEQPNVSDS